MRNQSYTVRYGGLYVDLDFECLRSIDTLLELHHGVVLALAYKDKTLHDRYSYVDGLFHKAYLIASSQQRIYGQHSRA